MTNFSDLLTALAGAPSLPGARCRGRHHLFDPGHPDEEPATTDRRHAQALGLCHRCPALTRCSEWLDSLHDRDRPPGVVAAQVVAEPPAARRRNRQAPDAPIVAPPASAAPAERQETQR